ncbi:hypothetical protein [Nocardioides maradonensis]
MRQFLGAAKHRRRTKRSRARAVLLGALAIAAAGGVGAAHAMTSDSGSYSVEVTDNTQCASASTSGGAIAQYFGDGCQSFGTSGTGNYDTFLQIQNTPTEQAFNTDAKNQLDEGSSPNWNRSIKVSAIPVVMYQGQRYFELWNDINESNSTKRIDLTDVEVYFSDDPNLANYPFTGQTGVSKQYDFSGDIRINDVNQGSGRGDLRYLVPTAGMDIPANCSYGDSSCSKYFVLYSKWGNADGADPYASDGGFEEWKVKQYPFVQVTKTVNATYTRTYGWTLAKTPPADVSEFYGQSQDGTWNVTATKDAGTISDAVVSGTITVNNTSALDATVSSVNDVLSVDGAVSASCGTLPVTLKPGKSLTCTYSKTLPSGGSVAPQDQTNTATATLDSGVVYSGSAPVTFVGTPVNNDITVTDGASSWTVSSTNTHPVKQSFPCTQGSAATDTRTVDNTATSNRTDPASASMNVTCYGLDVAKTATGDSTTTYGWTLSKKAPADVDEFYGQSADESWQVTATKDSGTVSGSTVSGAITVTNPAPIPATGVAVADQLDVPGTAVIDCDPSTAGNQATATIAANSSVDCAYTVPQGSSTAATSNTATATLAGVDYAKQVGVTWNPSTPVNDSITITDGASSWTVSSTDTHAVPQSFPCTQGSAATDTRTVTNTATSPGIASASASMKVTCYGLNVAKTAQTSFTRTHSWSVAKKRVIVTGEHDFDGDPSTLALANGETYLATYQVGVTHVSAVDTNANVSGTITVTNPAPIPATGVAVADRFGAMDITVVCPGGGSTVDIPKNSSVQCTYTKDLAGTAGGTNNATATLAGVAYGGSASVTFGAPSTETDECVTVTDDMGTPANTADDKALGTVCAKDLAVGATKSFTYTMTIGPFATCGPHAFTNTATLVTNDTATVKKSSYTVNASTPCDTGFTLTQGYWKTHNDSFKGGAPSDPTWAKIGPLKEKTIFFKSGQTYYAVMTTPPAGNPYYQLAKQYIAAVLNSLNGAGTSCVDTQMAQAKVLFQTYTPAQVKNGSATLKSQFVSLANTLTLYNEGKMCVPHADQDPVSPI